MAMTKAERAEIDALKVKLALRWSGAAPPERMPLPEKGYVNGWDFNLYRGHAIPCWSERTSHGVDEHRSDDGTQYYMRGNRDGRRLYATKREALIALRLERESECAALLHKIDQLIEAEP
jgi:hypothetical protein